MTREKVLAQMRDLRGRAQILLKRYDMPPGVKVTLNTTIATYDRAEPVLERMAEDSTKFIKFSKSLDTAEIGMRGLEISAQATPHDSRQQMTAKQTRSRSNPK